MDEDELDLSATSSDESIVSATVSGTNLTLRPEGFGKVLVTVRAVDPGNQKASETFSVTVFPPIPGSEEPVSVKKGDGSWTLDLNESLGDQDVHEISIQPLAEFTLELINKQGIEATVGASLVLLFDPSVVEPVERTIEGRNGLVKLSSATEGPLLTFAMTSLQPSPINEGSIARVVFRVSEGFSGETEIVLLGASIAKGFEELKSKPNASVVIRSGGAPEPSPDFDGDGVVGFSDFVEFAQRFGTSQGQPNFDARFDLDRDNTVGFSDFVLFAQKFGQSVKPAVLTKPAGRLAPGVNGAAGLTLVQMASEMPDQVEVVVGLTGAVQVQGYSLRLAYDASALELVNAMGQAGSLFTGEDGPQTVALQVRSEDGKVVLADVLRPDGTVQGEGDLVRLAFRVLDERAPGHVEVAGVWVSDGSGKMNELLGARLEGIRPVPSVYALHQNYPNPFNPETQIAYQLPGAGEVSLVFYNMLGQQVQTLVRERQEAGFYRVRWDGRDAQGRQVASGIYLYRLVTDGGEFTAVRRMVLLK